MTKTYQLLGHTVKVVPAEEHPGRMCQGCVFHGNNACPSSYQEAQAGIPYSCIEGEHKYVGE